MKLCALWVLLFSLHIPSLQAAPITVPNGDFSNAANNGSIQGTLVSGGATATPLGAGPWSASTMGTSGLLLPPTAAIGNGVASVSNLSSLNAVGSNSATFFQTLAAQPYAANTLYTLSTSIIANSSLTSATLVGNGIGIALTAGGTGNVVASSLSSSNVSLTLLTGTTYQLTLQYQSTAVPPVGNLGINLVAGQGATLASANLLGSVAFDNVALDAVVPEPSTYVLLLAGAALLAWISRQRFRRARQAC